MFVSCSVGSTKHCTILLFYEEMVHNVPDFWNEGCSIVDINIVNNSVKLCSFYITYKLLNGVVIERFLICLQSMCNMAYQFTWCNFASVTEEDSEEETFLSRHWMVRETLLCWLIG